MASSSAPCTASCSHAPLESAARPGSSSLTRMSLEAAFKASQFSLWHPRCLLRHNILYACIRHRLAAAEQRETRRQRCSASSKEEAVHAREAIGRQQQVGLWWQRPACVCFASHTDTSSPTSRTGSSAIKRVIHPQLQFLFQRFWCARLGNASLNGSTCGRHM